MSFKDKINVYKCTFGHEMITKDIDEGVTPMYLTCDKCGGYSRSSFYNVDQSLKHTHEWYKPTKDEIKKLDYNSKEHVKNGGLLLKKL